MDTLIPILIPFYLADIINPILFAGVLYGLGSRHPFTNAFLIILSYFLSYFLSGLALTIALDSFGEAIHFPIGFDYVIEFIVAILLIYFGWTQYSMGNTHPEDKLHPSPYMSVYDAIALGLQINFIGLTLAIPYLAVIDQILKASLPIYLTFGLLLLYNILYVLPYIGMIAIKWIYKEESRPILEKANRWLDHISTNYLSWIFIILGMVLIEDCISYFLGYREYSLLGLYT